MGDWFQTVVDREAPLADAENLGTRIRDWLISEGIVGSEKTECVLGGDGIGFPPGAKYELATDDPRRQTLTLRTNGLDIVTRRCVFHSGQGGFDLVCRQCRFRFDPKGRGAWGNAVKEWWEDKGPGLLTCPKCSHADSVTEWTHDPPWGFGSLGFEFWNWPPLKKAFVDEVTRRLGHRTVLVAGKL